MPQRDSPVRKDALGIYVRTNGAKYRPGKVAGYDHVFRMDDGGLIRGDRAIVRHRSQSPLCKVAFKQNGKEIILHWHVED
jgi:hypothetical protein